MYDKQSPGSARLVTIVTVRRLAGKAPIVRVATEPDVALSKICRRMEAAIPDMLLRELPAGQYRIAQTSRSGSRMLSSPPSCPAELLDRLIDALLDEMVGVLRMLRETLDAFPDTDTAANLAAEAYEAAFQDMLQRGMIESLRPGCCRLVVTSHPSGLDTAEDVAEKNERVCAIIDPDRTSFPVLVVYDAVTIRVFVATVRDDLPFSGVLKERFCREVDRVHDAVLERVIRETFVSVSETAARLRKDADHIARAFRFDGSLGDDPESVDIFQGGGSVGEA